jgi:hypothetical protein
MINKKNLLFSLLVLIIITIISYIFFNKFYKDTHLVAIDYNVDEIIKEYQITRDKFASIKFQFEQSAIQNKINLKDHYITDAFHKYGLRNVKYPNKSFFLIQSSEKLILNEIFEIEKIIINQLKLIMEPGMVSEQQDEQEFQLQPNNFFNCYFKKIVNLNNKKQINKTNGYDIILENTKTCLDENKNLNDLNEIKLDRKDILELVSINNNKNIHNLKEKIVFNSMIYIIFFGICFILFLNINIIRKK